MRGRVILVGGVAAIAALGLAVVPRALAVTPPPTGSGTHGCVLSDVNGQSLPVVHNSDTSVIGGNECDNITVVETNNPPDGGEGYVASAASWSIVACTPEPPSTTTTTTAPSTTTTTLVPPPPVCTPGTTYTYSSADGSVPVGTLTALRPGDIFTAKVSNGTLIVGTPNGVNGA